MAQNGVLEAGPLSTGNDYIRYCEADVGSVAFLVCAYYTRGVVEGFTMRDEIGAEGEGALRTSRLICLPPQSVAGQWKDITLRYLEENPEKRHWLARELMLVALLEAFPCAPQSKR